MNKTFFPYQEVLMVDPKYFNVEYSINPHMVDANGQLNQINKENAIKQWNDLKKCFENIDLKVHVLAPQKQLPDMVFSANQSFIFLDFKTNEKTAVISNMRSKYRKKETAFFKDWYLQNNYKVIELDQNNLLKEDYCFEGNGDIIPHPDFSFFWGGIGPRTDAIIYNNLETNLNLKFQTLKLIHPDFYHLDTCFVVLGPSTCAFVPDAFDKQDIKKIENSFSKAIPIDLHEGKIFFAANAFCPDGKNVIVQTGTKKFKSDLKQHNFNVIEVDTSEYMKSGGSVFCMKMALL